MDPKKEFFGWQMLANIVTVCAGIAFYMAIANFSVVREQISFLLSVCSPFITGLAIAYLLNIPLCWFEKNLLKNVAHKRSVAILLVYTCTFLFLYLLGNLIMPQVITTVVQLVNNMQLYLSNLNTLINDLATRFTFNAETREMLQAGYTDLVTTVTKFLSTGVPQLLNWSVSFGKGIFSFITAVIASIYFLADKDRFLLLGQKIVYAFSPSRQRLRVLDLLSRANRVFSGFISGKLLDSFIIAILCFCGTYFINQDLAVLISVIIGFTNIIPFFGPFIGAIPCIVLLLVIDPMSALWFALFVLVLQQFDGNILGPKILGDSTGLSAVWVLVAIVVFGGLFGFIGMLIGVPVFSVVAYVLADILEQRLRRKGLIVKDGAIVTKEQTQDSL